MPYQSIDEILRKMEHYCAYQERSHFQVEQKLREYDLIPEAQDHIILHLIQNNFLNEERFAHIYVRGKFYHNKWGKQKIIQGLKQHKIQTKLINNAIEKEIPKEDYVKNIMYLIEKKKREITTKNSFLKKQKIISFLRQKGYDFEDISSHITSE